MTSTNNIDYLHFYVQHTYVGIRAKAALHEDIFLTKYHIKYDTNDY